MAKLKIAVTGAAGRMGRELIRVVHGTEECVLAGAVEQAGSLALGQDAGLLAGLGKLGVIIGDDALELFSKIDAVLDFSVPAASLEFAALAANARIIHVMGTTGLSAADEAKVAAALDADFDIEVLEMHHRHKVDAPSGTALMLGHAAAEGRKVRLEDVSVRSRDGHTGERRRGDIGFASLRGGSVVGDHSVIFAADGERIELVHRAADRGIYARGAVKAALWGRGQGPGLFDMMDVLGIESAAKA